MRLPFQPAGPIATGFGKGVFQKGFLGVSDRAAPVITAPLAEQAASERYEA
jgi:hypothetical protein